MRWFHSTCIIHSAHPVALLSTHTLNNNEKSRRERKERNERRGTREGDDVHLMEEALSKGILALPLTMVLEPKSVIPHCVHSQYPKRRGVKRR